MTHTTYALTLAAFDSIPVRRLMMNTENTGFAWTMYTGDLVTYAYAYDLDNQISTFVYHPSSKN